MKGKRNKKRQKQKKRKCGEKIQKWKKQNREKGGI